MEQLLSNIEWVPVLVSFLVAYGMGSYWYSNAGWGKKWREGKGVGVWQAPLWMPMTAQAGATFLLAVIINLFSSEGHLTYSILTALTIAGFIKANGLFAGKTKYAITVEVTYVLVMVLLMVAVNMVL